MTGSSDDPAPASHENRGDSAPTSALPGAPKAIPPHRPRLKELHAKLILAAIFAALVCLLLLQAPWPSETTAESQSQTTPPLAKLLFEGYGPSLVLLSIVMAAAMLGGVFLAREDPEAEEKEGDGEGETRNGSELPERRQPKGEAEVGKGPERMEAGDNKIGSEMDTGGKKEEGVGPARSNEEGAGGGAA